MSDSNPLCPYCGAYHPDRCDMPEEYGCCPWIESGEFDRTHPPADDEDER